MYQVILLAAIRIKTTPLAELILYQAECHWQL